MAMALLTRLCPNPCSSSSSSSSSSRSVSRFPLSQKKMKFSRVCIAAACPNFLSFESVSRREVVLAGLLAGLAFPSAYIVDQAAAAEALETGSSMALQVDNINAYSYSYPLRPGKKSRNLSVESRKPERYSSAAPLSPDARQRIVSERLDLKNNIVVSVSVGPINSTFLKTNDSSTWDAKDVARSVLSDKSTARMTTGQRVAEINILDAKREEVDGNLYWHYEYLVQKSPTVTQRGYDVFRHSLAVTAEREGYLYSLNASTLDSSWQMMEPLFRETVASFHLNPPTDEYVPPYKDPWRFW
ncbi:unnamed protein product [Sphagnum jensenii]|uniref:PsbP C-terminal domain-containing protein n=1 Tax=Sphagnum jensenii TaxID=128206 RepID=A0ABP0VLJ6_9BRYO